MKQLYFFVVSLLLLTSLSSPAAYAQIARNKHKGNVAYRDNYQRSASGSLSYSSYEIRGGELWAWGYNNYGQLGNGNTVNQIVPTRSGADNDWVLIAAGTGHALGIKSNGTLWAWGYNGNGQLGIGSTADQTTPVQVGTDNKWVSISCGNLFSLGLKSDGTLWSWGFNSLGQLGTGNNTQYNSPVQVGTDNKWTSISAGFGHAAGLKSDGSVWTWGNNGNGELGIGNTVNQNSPVVVFTLSKSIAVACGGYHTLVIRSDGSLYAFGYGVNGGLGIGITPFSQSIPVLVGADNKWTSISAGEQYSAATKVDGTLWAWGYNASGQLGLGNTVDRNVPVQVGTDNSWVSVVCAANHMLPFKADGTLWATGDNNYGTLGNGSTLDQSTLGSVDTLVDNWIQISTGENHALAVKSNGTLWAWGNGGSGQLGNGSSTTKFSPIQVGTANNWIAVSAGASYSLGLRADGTMWSWGANTDGQLGNSSATPNVPVQVGTGNTWKSISAGAYHSLGVKNDGTLWAWGHNSEGQLGIGSTTAQTAPTQAGFNTSWVTASCGGDHSMGLQADGTLWGAGWNAFGELGLGNYTQQNSFVAVGGTISTAVASGGGHTLTLKSDGTVYATGWNIDGEIGQGTATSTYNTFQLVPGISNAIVVSGKWLHSHVILTDGTVEAFGYNSNGQLGDGTSGTNRTSPVAIPGIAGAVALGGNEEGGHFFNGLLRATRTEICLTGLNSSGQLGDGTNVQRTSYNCITIIPSITGSSSINPTSCITANGSITLTGLVTGNSYIVNYSFGGVPQAPATIVASSGSVVITGLAAGTYTNFTVAFGGSTSSVYAGPITLVNPTPAISGSSFVNPTTCGSSNGTITLTGLVTGSSYTINYSKGGTPQTAVVQIASGGAVTLTGLGAGSYTNFTVTVAGCVSNTLAGPVTLVNPSPVISGTSFTSPTTCGGTNGSITLNGLVTGNSYTINYSLGGTPQTPVVQTAFANAVTLTGLSAGAYTNLSVTLSTCTSNVIAGPITLTSPTAPVITTVTSTDATTCGGANGALNIQGLTPSTIYNYSFFNGTTTVSGSGVSNVSGTIILTGLPAATYSAISVTLSGCTTVYGSSVIIANPAAPVVGGSSSTNPSFCGGSDGTISLSGFAGNAGYVVSYSKGGVAQPQANLVTNAGGVMTINGMSAGTYTNFTVTSSSTNCVSAVYAGPVTLTNPAPVISGTSVTSPTTCGGTNGSITLNGLTTGTSYTINYSLGGIAQTPVVQTAAGGSVTLTGLGAGSYTNLSVTVATCTSNIISGPINLVAPAAPVIAGSTFTNPTTCGGSNGTITLLGMTNGSSYTINYLLGGTPQTPVIQTASGGSVTVSGLSAGTYSAFTVTLAGCTSNPLAVPIALSNPTSPIISGSTATNPSTCTATDGTITLTGLVTGTSYTINYSKGGTPQTPVVQTAVANTVTLTGLGAGSYTGFTVVKAGCTSNTLAGPVVLTGTSPVISGTTATNPTTCGGTNGSITINGLTTGNSYSIDYSLGGTPQTPVVQTAVAGAVTLTNLSAGSYTNISVTFATCTSNTVSGPISLTAPSAPTITGGSSTNPTACAAADGTITLTGLITGSSYTINYSKGGTPQTAVVQTAASNVVTLTGLGAGTYTNFTVTLAGCISNTLAGPVTLVAPSPVISGTTSVNPSTCGGTNGSITINGLTTGNSYTINYSLGGTPQTPVVQTAVAGAVTLTGLSAGSYTNISVTFATCTSNIVAGPISLTAPSAPTITGSTSTNPTACASTDGTITLTGLITGSSYTINYSKGGTPQTAVVQTATASTVTLTGLGAGSYTNFTVTLAGCISNTLAGPVTLVAPSPVISGTTSVNPSTCGGTNGSITINGLTTGNSYTINYSLGGTPQTPVVQTAVAGAVTLTGLSAGSYTNISVTFATCTSNIVAGPISLTAPSAPTITGGTSTNPSACASTDGTITLTGLITGSSYTINYSKGGTPQTAVVQTATASTVTLTGLGAGSYTNFTVTLAGCISNTLAGPVTLVAPSPVISGTTSVNPSICGGTNGSITINGLTTGNSYTINYSLGGTPQTPVVQTAVAGAVTLTGLSAGSYTNISVTFATCTSNVVAGPISLTAPSAPTITGGTSTNPSACASTDGTITLTGLITGSSYTINYSKGGTPQTAVVQTATASTVTLTGLGAGSYTNFTVTLAGCISNTLAGPVTLVAPSPVISGTTSVNPSICGGTNGSITINGLTTGNSYTINYSLGGTPQTPVVQTAVAGAVTLTGLSAGSYTNISVTFATCTSNVVAGPISLTAPSAPTITGGTSTNPSACASTDGTITLTGLITGSSYTINYSKGGTPQTAVVQTAASNVVTLTGLGAGTYTNFTVTLAGCISNTLAGPVTLVAPSPVISGTTSVNPSTCGGTNGSITINGLTTGNSYTINYSLGGTPQTPVIQTAVAGAVTLTGLSAGSYTNISVTFATCTSNIVAGPISLTAPSAPTITGSTSTNPTACAATDGTITLTGLVTGNSYTINYSKGGTAQTPVIQTAAANTVTLTGLGAGSYTNFTVTLAGCISNTLAGPVTLTSPSPVISGTTSINPSTCGGANGSITINGLTTGNSYTINYSLGGTPQTPVIQTAVAGAVTLTGLSAGSYTNISVTFATCTSNIVAGPIGLTAPSAPTITGSTSTNPTACASTDGTITLTGLITGSSYTINYSKGGTPQTAVVQTATANTVTLTGLGAGSYTNFTVTLAGCVSNTLTGPVTLTGASPVIASVTPTNPTTCGGSNGSLLISGLTTGSSYTINYSLAGTPQTPVIQTAAAGSVTLTGLAAGSYTNISVTLATCTSNIITGPFSLTAPAAPVIGGSSFTNPTSCATNNGSITLTGLTTGSSYTINYSLGGTPQTPVIQTAAGGVVTLSSLGAGSYTNFTVTLAGCISNTLAGPVTLVAPAPVISGTSSVNPTTCGGTNGTITLAGLTTGSSYTINYSLGGTPQTPSIQTAAAGTVTLTGLSAGSYTNISVTFAGCVSNIVAGPISLTPPSSPVISGSSFTNPTTCGGANGTITLTGLTTGSSYTVNYSLGGTPQTPAIQTAAGGAVTLTGLIAGSYSNFTVTFAGCISNTLAGPVTLVPPTAPVITSVTSVNPTTCGGTNGSITINGLTASTSYTITYVNSATTTTLTGQTTNASGSVTITGLAAGTYTSITAILSGCSGVYSGTVTLVPPASPVITSVTTVSPTACGGANGFFTINGLLPATSYTITYFNGSSTVTLTGQVTNAGGAVSVTNLPAGTYTSVTAILAGCSGVYGSAVTIAPPTAATISSASVTNPTTCGGTGSITLNGLLPNTTYTVTYFNGTATTTVTGQTTNASGSVTVGGVPIGTFSAITAILSGCSSTYSGTLTLVPPPTPVIASVTSTNPTTCLGTEGTITLTGLVAGTSYTVNYTRNTVAATPVVIIANASGNVVIPGRNAGTYNAFNVTANNCLSTSTTTAIVLSDPAPPVANVTIFGPSTVCDGSSVSLSTPTGTGYAYQWKLGVSNVGTNLSTYAATVSGSYSVVVTANNCTSTSNSVTVTVNPIPALTSSLTPPAVCSNTPFSYTPASTVTGTTYTWSRAVVSGISNTAGVGIGPVNETLINTTATPVTVTYAYTLTANNCSQTQSVQVIIRPTPLLTSSLTPPAVCSNTPFVYSPTGNISGTSFSWTRPVVAGISNIAGSGNGNINETLFNTTNLPVSVIYNYLLTANTCTNTQQVVAVINPLVTPTAAITASATSVCAGVTVTFNAGTTNAGSAPTRQWFVNNVLSGTGTAFSYVPLNGDVVKFVLGSNENCASPATVTSNTITMTVIPLVTPIITILASDTVLCAGQPVTFSSIIANGGSSPQYQWRVNNVVSGTSAPTFSMTNPADFDVITATLISNALCASPTNPTSNQIRLRVRPITVPGININANANMQMCAGTNVTFVANINGGGTAPAYQWRKNSQPVGNNQPTYTYVPANQDTISCILTSNAFCTTNPIKESNKMVAQIVQYVTPTAVITANPALGNYIPGQTINFTATVAYPGLTPAYQWMRNGIDIFGANGLTYSTNNLRLHDRIQFRMTSSESCAIQVFVTSNALDLTGTGVSGIGAATSGWLLTPNPNRGQFRLMNQDAGKYAGKTVKVYITNLVGQVLYEDVQLMPADGRPLSLGVGEQIADGYYLLRVQADDRVSTLKFEVIR